MMRERQIQVFDASSTMFICVLLDVSTRSVTGLAAQAAWLPSLAAQPNASRTLQTRQFDNNPHLGTPLR
jgi:hypothetical protein